MGKYEVDLTVMQNQRKGVGMMKKEGVKK